MRHVAPVAAPSPPAAEDIQGETEASPPPSQCSDPAPVAVALLHPTPTASASPKYVGAVSYLRPPAVDYPAVSRRMNEQGRVVVRVLIDTQGRVLQVELEQASRMNASTRPR
jgi:protein TonB